MCGRVFLEEIGIGVTDLRKDPSSPLRVGII
jgi:hypothetical protein